MTSEHLADLDDAGGSFCGYSPFKAFSTTNSRGAWSSPASRPHSVPNLDYLIQRVNGDPTPERKSSRKRGILSKFRGLHLHWKWPRRVRPPSTESPGLDDQTMTWLDEGSMSILEPPTPHFLRSEQHSAEEQDSLYRYVPRKRGYCYSASLALHSTTSASDLHTMHSFSTRPTSCYWCGSTMSVYAQGGDPVRVPNNAGTATPASVKLNKSFPQISPPHNIRPSYESSSSVGGPVTPPWRGSDSPALSTGYFQPPAYTKALPPVPFPSTPPLPVYSDVKHNDRGALGLDTGAPRSATPIHESRNPDTHDTEAMFSNDSNDHSFTGFGPANSRRNTEFHALFPGVSSEDNLVEDYDCALQREALVQGRLYVASHHICFRANALGPAANLVLSFDEIIDLEKKAVSHGALNAIQVGTWSAKYTFVSFLSREVAYEVIHNIWRLLHPYWPGSGSSVELQSSEDDMVPGPVARPPNPEIEGAKDQPTSSPQKPFGDISQPGSMSARSMFECLVEHGCPNLTLCVNHRQTSSRMVTGGAFGDIWRGKLYDGTEIAIKVWRFTSLTEDMGKSLKRAMREIYNWSKTDHENVHKLLGVIMFQGRLGMVSRWMEDGNLREYIRKNPDVDRHQLCVQVARGVEYLHRVDIVHGDLKACNILISSEGTAKLTDFDYSVMSSYSLRFSETTRLGGGTLRWMAPELVFDPLCRRSKEADIYALGMTFLEIITGTIPYYPEYQTDAHVVVQLTRRAFPSRTNHFGNDWRGDLMWALLMRCWSYDPSLRPTAHDVLDSMACLVPLSE